MKAKDTFFSTKKTLNCNGKLIDLSSPIVMGILNITPDSFFDGGKYTDEQIILDHVNKMLCEGASIIDIGAYSSRPGANDVDEKEELKRLIPKIRLIKNLFPEIVISVDTFRARVAELAVQEGAGMINDISGGTLDKDMLEFIAEVNTPYVLTHIQGSPQNMQENPRYDDVITEVIDYFLPKIEFLKNRGVKDIIVDPGFGFGKTLEHNYILLSNLNLFKALECPVMVGISRKSMINKILQTKPSEALNGTTVAHTIALLKGVNILRAHDVKQAIETLKIVNYTISV